MPLSCECGYDYDADWWYYSPDDFTPMYEFKRRKRCHSCKKLIDAETPCLVFRCERAAKTDIEENIYGCEVPLANKYFCERCGEIFLNLTALKFCINLEDKMEDLLSDYHEMTGFRKEDYEKTGTPMH